MTIEAKWHYGHFIDLTVNVQCSVFTASSFQKRIKAIFSRSPCLAIVLAGNKRYKQICLASVLRAKREERIWQTTTTENWLFGVYSDEID